MAEENGIQQYKDKLKHTRKLLAESVKAGQFIADENGQVILSLIAEQISDLMNRAFSDKGAMSYEDYLSTYGKLTALRGLMAELRGKADMNVVLNEQVKQLNEQLKATEGV